MTCTKNVTLGEITTKIGSGLTPTGGKSAYKESGISLIRSLNVYDYTFEYTDLAHIDNNQAKKLSNVVVEPEDILLNITGASVARCCIVPDNVLPARVNQHVSIVRINKNVANPQYILYSINYDKNKSRLLSLAQGGATREALTKDIISSFEIMLPSLTSQNKIASILFSYDRLIENNTRRIRILEEMAQKLYREWFIKFKFPGHENVDMVESALGMIPEGWEVRKISKAAKIYRGKSYKSSDIAYDKEGLPFLNLKCIERDGGFRYDGVKWFSGQYKDIQTAAAGDIIMAVTDMTQERHLVARAARVPETSYKKYVFSMDLVRIEPLEGTNKEYLYSMFRFSSFPDIIKQHANGANVLHLNPEHIANFDMLYAPIAIQRRYSDISCSIFKECDMLEMKNNNLRSTRDLLLPKLISGELDVENLEIVQGGV